MSGFEHGEAQRVAVLRRAQSQDDDAVIVVAAEEFLRANVGGQGGHGGSCLGSGGRGQRYDAFRVASMAARCVSSDEGVIQNTAED